MEKFAALSLGIFLAVLVVAVGFAQEPAPAPKPGPQHEKLAYFVGRWATEADVKPSAFGPGGKYTATETCEWLAGKFAVLCKAEGSMMGGEIHELSVMSYDTGENSYIYFSTNNWGENAYSRGSVDGDTWTWSNESKVNGQTVKGRFTLKRVSPDAATFTFEMAMGTQPLAMVMTGKQTRMK
jgi:hypothetical protein